MRDEAQTIGPYRTLRELGRGGQAIVWLAEDTRIHREVALKVMPHLGPGGEDALLRFRREAEVASRLQHPGICPVLEADLDRGVPYIAMRYVPGETVAHRIAAARAAGVAPPDREGLRELAVLFEKAARALHAAHEAGVIHRDIKPANLMVTREGEPVILDFGMARQDDATSASLTLTGETSGTPAYMSPEQMTGRSRPDRRTDVWSLGVALHECATLRHPFEAATRESLFQAILSDDPPDPRKLNPAVDRDFATILETATAKERDRRYQSALDLAEDLRRWVAREPTRARAVGRIERVRRWAQRKPALAASGAAIVVLLIAASALLAYGVGASGRADVESKLRSAAEAAQRSAEAASALAESERARADAARAALEQAQVDRRFADELDELNIQVGTLWFGMEAQRTALSVVPKVVASFRQFGIDLEEKAPVAPAIARLLAFLDRNPAHGSVVHTSLSQVRYLAALDETRAMEPVSERAGSILDGLPGSAWPELERAEDRFDEAGVDEFDALLTDAALEGKTADQLADLAGTLLPIPERAEAASKVIDRALQLDPGSFQAHFIAGALGFMQMKRAKDPDPAKLRPITAKIVYHMQVAVALRPRSGFVRAMLANALAVNGNYPESMRCIQEATDLEPDNALVWMFKAQYFGHTSFPERGIEACLKAIQLDPDIRGARELLDELQAKMEGKD